MRHARKILAAIVFGCALTPAMAQNVALIVTNDDKYGPHLTDEAGRSFYMFSADQQGTDSAPAVSNCNDACAEAWPPLTITDPLDVRGRIDENLIGQTERADGSTQVTFGGWPLYYYARHEGVGRLSGQLVEEFGGIWYLVAPDGAAIKEK